MSDSLTGSKRNSTMHTRGPESAGGVTPAGAGHRVAAPGWAGVAGGEGAGVAGTCAADMVAAAVMSARVNAPTRLANFNGIRNG
jgi:hypothetical protein